MANRLLGRTTGKTEIVSCQAFKEKTDVES